MFDDEHRHSHTMDSCRVSVLVLLVLVMSPVTTTTAQPQPTPSTTSTSVWLDTHVHATDDPSDDIWSPEEAIAWHQRNGYNAMVITNHLPTEYISPERLSELMKSDLCAPSGFVVLPGREYALKNCHLVLMFDPATYSQQWPDLPTKVGVNPFDWCYDRQQLTTLIAEWHTLGALVVLAHPHLRENPCEFQPTMQDWRDMGLDFVERISSGIWDFGNQYEVDGAGLRVVAGTDGHSRLKTGPGGYTRLQLDGVYNASKAVLMFRELRNGTVWVEIDVTRVGWRYVSAVLGAVLGVVACMSALVAAMACRWCRPDKTAEVVSSSPPLPAAVSS
jgi:hypothetical protein